MVPFSGKYSFIKRFEIVVLPPPLYNFARIPRVHERDEWWYRKQNNLSNDIDGDYIDIHMPKNSGSGFLIGMATFVFGAALIWHIWWLAILSFGYIVFMVIKRTMDDDSEYVIKAEDLRKMDNQRGAVV